MSAERHEVLFQPRSPSLAHCDAATSLDGPKDETVDIRQMRFCDRIVEVPVVIWLSARRTKLKHTTIRTATPPSKAKPMMKLTQLRLKKKTGLKT